MAVRDADGSSTYRETFDHAAGIARHLDAFGVEAGEPVATCFANSRRAVAACYGTILSGVCEAPVNARLAEGDVRNCLAAVRPRIFLTDRAGLARLGQVAAQVAEHVVAVEEIPPSPIEALPPRPVDPGDRARIVFTSGTTGRPKGIVHSQIGRWTGNLLLRATLPVAPSRRNILLLTPFSHGASLLTFAFLDGGGSVTLLDGADPDQVVPLLEAGAVDQIFAPPTVLAKLLPDISGRSFPGIKAIFCGTAPLSRELYVRTRAIFGPVVRITYGKSEVFNPITILEPEETDAWYSEGEQASACVGWPASGVEIRIDEDGALAESGAGPVLVRARHMLAGTLGENGFEPQDPDGFHRTGDIGFLDPQGRLHLCGREADVIKTGGYRITPEEVESALRPALRSGELVVLGLPSEYWGEVIAVVAAAAPNSWIEDLGPAISGMTAFKRPRLFAALDELPRNALGKISRSEARRLILEDHVVSGGPRPVLTRRDGR